ncbi:DNA-(apurinic or apyrimidinic site) lyase [Carboxydocella sporoproducens DSM 16521]|uniref:Formamidopyrimidine-DNA glycosylase n=2 Tax=Carboxydocella TaxID=178898 RepID=A0A1T4LAH6_9FIRM|nr:MULTISPECIES: DNA-formamidopyrimidine glycosylase [Carboxydocella]AVX19886.1 DNA-(apurinic or apyrimidinic site) lyase [Carboxydocella thermautotrophica]AVX30295.1 DNA-(apurinic or apyrimidinic site) lyase [Carboxydocella thermautotrophica]SJZ51507.1 DNA-(apurinic or apyrimidinic site) lyase [Carboxydocella sporoproducens DSM 16521]
MPELPEVETVRRSLSPLVCGQEIRAVEVLHPGVIKGVLNARAFVTNLMGRRFVEIRRRGKYLLFLLDDGQVLLIHLRMTGRLVLAEAEAPLLPHTHLIWHLSSGQQLRFSDVRRFGEVRLCRQEQLEIEPGLARLGPEPLEQEWTVATLAAAVRGKKAPIKNILLNQEIVAGLGNIYADEALYRAGIKPDRPGQSLSQEEIERLWLAVRQVLAEGIENRGTSFSDYVDGLGQKGQMQTRLKVYGRSGSPCHSCGTILEKMRLAGRSTVYCPVCQQ